MKDALSKSCLKIKSCQHCYLCTGDIPSTNCIRMGMIRDNFISSRFNKKVGSKLSKNSFTLKQRWLVLPCIRMIRHNDSYSLSAIFLQCTNHLTELHQVIVDAVSAPQIMNVLKDIRIRSADVMPQIGNSFRVRAYFSERILSSIVEKSHFTLFTGSFK